MERQRVLRIVRTRVSAIDQLKVEEQSIAQYVGGVGCARQVEQVVEITAVFVAAIGADDDEVALIHGFLHEFARPPAGAGVELGGVDAAQPQARGMPHVEPLIDAGEDGVAVDDTFAEGFDGVEFAAAAAVHGKVVASAGLCFLRR